VWRQVRVAVEPACTVMTVLVFAVGFGPPLQTMSLEVTSWIGWVSVSRVRGGWFREEGQTHAIIGGNSHTIADCAAVQRGEDGVSSRGRCCCSENERRGELHVVCWLWSSEPLLGAAPAMLYTHHNVWTSTLQTQFQGQYEQSQYLVRCLASHLHSVNRCSHQPPSVLCSFTPWFLFHLLICANSMTEWLDLYSRVARVLDCK
jgi:hypothetical protein